jgi:hypothetical protein
MRPRCYFRIDICRLLEHGCHVNELHLRTPELGHWGKDFNNGFALRLSSSVALLVFKMGTEIILLRIFTEAGVARVELPVCWQLKASFALTDGLLQDPPIIPPEVIGSTRHVILPERRQISIAMSSGYSKVQAFIQKTASNRQLFEIELSIAN